MLTPSFTLGQDGKSLYITIKAPFAKIDEADVFMEGNDFRFHSKPYFLRLTLPGEVVEDNDSSCKYDTDKGEFNIKVTKVKPGEEFEGLDMLTKLLATPGSTSAKAPVIEVVGGSEAGAEDGQEMSELGEAAALGWQIKQEPYMEEAISLEAPHYGFANQRCGVLKRLTDELQDIIDLPEADSTPVTQRAVLRIAAEQEKFTDDHYLADKYEDGEIMELIMYKPPWVDDYMKMTHDDSRQTHTIEFSDAEKERMRNLPRKEYLLDRKSTQQAFLSLVDILFAYAYNERTTDGENTAESAWTISKLSATLSWLQSYNNVEEVAVACYRRALSYPLYRHWKLCNKVWMDVMRILTIGKRCMLKCLLEIHELLVSTDGHYILNDLYITDYCVWLQSQSDKTIASLATEVKAVELLKSDVGLELDALELAAEEVTKEEESANQMTAQVASLSIDSTQCQKCTPSPTAAQQPLAIDASSFPAAHLDLASSCSSDTETSSEEDDDNDEEEEEEEEESTDEESDQEDTEVNDLSVIVEESSSLDQSKEVTEITADQSKEPQQNRTDKIKEGQDSDQTFCNLEGKSQVDKKVDNTSLNF